MRSFIYFCLLLLSIGITSCAIGTGDPLEDLSVSENGLFVAVTNGGRIMVSREGKAWIQVATTGMALPRKRGHEVKRIIRYYA